ncbi:hypothetical protein FUAX_28310 [Fulvitalea axinellae]|uniref:Uncharacterized protein n=1 Tax=Fulvitalea axinellae TaxID=1182444 RepID=A0AAU9D792_9BACT|nr:hypothetical protein FUAX_28310 [Fulvitalea axinellae]
MRRILLLTLVCLFSSVMVAEAQRTKKKRKKKKKAKTERRSDQPSSVEFSDQSAPLRFAPMPGTYTLSEAERKKRIKQREIFNKKQQKAHDKAMKDLAKAKRKEAKLKKKPQYSDPTYFGHKKKPKWRKPGKMKFCKDCGQVH